MVVNWKYISSSWNLAKLRRGLQVDHGGAAYPAFGIIAGQTLSHPLAGLSSGPFQLKEESSWIPPGLLPLGCHRNVQQFVNPIWWDDTRNGVSNGNTQPRPESLWSINVDRWRITVSVGTHKAQEARKAKGMISVSVGYKYFGDFAWFDASRPLNLELKRTRKRCY